MSEVGYVIGFCDFESELPVGQVANLLSLRVFGGIPFVSKDSDDNFDEGNLCLEKDFIGMQVELIAGEGRFTLEVGTCPSASVESSTCVWDLSRMLQQRIEQEVLEVKIVR